MEAEIAQISVFLAKDGRTFSTIVDQDRISKIKGVRITDFVTDGAACRFIYFETTSAKSNPPWADFLNEKLPQPDRIKFGARSSSANGILLLLVEKRVFVAAFGRSAQSYIEMRGLEPDFGIKTAMNMCGNEELRQTKSQSNSIAITHIDRQVSRPSETFVFGLGDAEDLRYISAHMKGTKNITLQGRDNLTVKIIGKEKLTWTRLIDHCKTFLKKFASKDFIKLFPNYKNLEPATELEAEALDNVLVAAVRAKNFGKLQICIPEFLSDEDYSFAYSNNAVRENIIYAFLDVSQLEKELNLKSVSLKKLCAKHIYAYSHEEDRILDSRRWSLYDCLVFEHTLNGKHFVLSNGQWSRFDAGFYASILEFVDKTLLELPCDPAHKNIDISDDGERKNRERIFNEQIIKVRPSCILFDQAKLRIGTGRSDKEFCDILDLQDDAIMRIINVKQYKDAASINYLFAQTKFYCEAFLGDLTFLTEIREHIQNSPSKRKRDYLIYVKPKNEEVNGQDYRLHLWLLYDRKDARPNKKDLPLMAQYELKLMHDHLRRVCKFREIGISFVPVIKKQYTTSSQAKAALA